MTLRNLSRVVSYGVILPILVIMLGISCGWVSFHGGEGMALVVAGYVLLNVSSLVAVVTGLRLRAHTHGRERKQLMLLVLVGGTPIILFLASLLFVLVDWIHPIT